MICELGTDLQHRNTFGVPAQARRVLGYTDANDLAELYSQGVFKEPWMVLGEGSNVLFTRHFPGTVLVAHDGSEVTWERHGSYAIVAVDATYPTALLINDLAEDGIWGLENLYGIPGTLGGAAVQNIGAYGVELSDAVTSLDIFDTTTGRLLNIDKEAWAPGYRTSILKQRPEWIVTVVHLLLKADHGPRLSYEALASRVTKKDITPLEMCSLVSDIRDAKLPAVYSQGSAGSFFKNPVVPEELAKAIGCPSHPAGDGMVKISAAWLIDHAGLKDLTSGGAAVWPKQPLVIYNRDNATGHDVLRLSRLVAEGVARRFGVTLEPEVVIV